MAISKRNQRKTHISLKGFTFTFSLGKSQYLSYSLAIKLKTFVAYPVTVAMVTLIWSLKNYYLCICITDIDCVKYVENNSYFVMLEGGSLKRIRHLVEYAIFCEIADYMMFWLPW